MSRRSIVSFLGPGIIFAATSIGVSHVVQSTRAGADFGYALIALVLLAHLVKLPFFQIGPRYAAATGTSLLDAYRQIGKPVYYFCMLFTLSTMFIVQAAVTIVAAGLLAFILPFELHIVASAAIILVSVLVILLGGGYRLLDNVLKLMMLLFAVMCLVTFIAIFFVDIPEMTPPKVDYLSASSIAFMVALVGWMPTTVEVSIWHSLWVVEQRKKDALELTTLEQQKQFTQNKLLDFNVSYVFCFLFALVFLILGAKVMHGSGLSLSDSAVGFSSQLVGIFSEALGQWSIPVVSIIIFIAMYSTVLAVADGFGQVITRFSEHELNLPKEKHKLCYRSVLPVIAIGGALVIVFFGGHLKSLIDFATTISFVAAPVFAYLNIRAMQLPNVPQPLRLSQGQSLYAWVCLLALAGFSLFFLIWRFG